MIKKTILEHNSKYFYTLSEFFKAYEAKAKLLEERHKSKIIHAEFNTFFIDYY